MEPHQQRVVEEKSELDEKLIKLNEFLLTPIYDRLQSDERRRLRSQRNIMETYVFLLEERIAAFI